MAGVYGPVNSRTDFFTLLADARRALVDLLRRAPQNPTLLSIAKQLEAIDSSTRANRQPTLEERTCIDMDLRAGRELSDTGDPTVDAFVQKISILTAYFEDWPSDEEAASAKDTDPVYLRRPPRP